jgi:capsular exopolysaccharide synthesis family protein
VALVDADLRRPSLHTVLGLTNQEGLSDLFRKPLHVSDVLRPYKGNRVLVMTSGDLPPNPTELLGSRRMDQIMSALREVADVVIVDGPPFFISDAWVLASRVDGLLWVTRLGFTRRGALRSLLGQARRTGAYLVGMIFNRLPKGQSNYATRYSYLSHYYGKDAAATQKQIEAPGVEPSERLLQPMLREKQEASVVAGQAEPESQYTNGHRVEVLPALPPELPTTERGKVSLDLLYALSYELASQLDLNELMQRILKMTLESVGASSGSMIAVDPKGEPIEGVMIYDGRTFTSEPQQLKDVVAKGLARWVIENRRPVVLNNTADDPRWLNRTWDEDPAEPRSAIAVPLMADDRVVGILTLVHPKANHFTRDDLSLLTAIAVGISFNSGAYAGQTR